MIFKNIFLASYWILCHLKSQRHFELNILMHQLIASTLFLLNPFYKILFFKEDNMRYLSGLVLHLMHIPIQFSSVQSLSHVLLFGTPWITARQASLSITNSQSLLKLMSIESVMPSNRLILCRSLLLLPSIFPSLRVFSNESALRIRWPKYWSCSFSIRPSSEHPGLISSMMDWLDLLAVQWTLKSLLQHHSSKASIFWHSAFFTGQLSHPYMTTEKNHSLDWMNLCWQK